MFSDMGINVVDEDEVEEAEPDTPEEESTELAERTGTAVASKSNTREGSDRTDDPVRMYLREMGSVELLSREGEIAIAKRIEAGRETMIEGLCESPLTFQAIIIWRDQLANAEILLRDIIDLEATYAGPDAKQAAPVMPSEIERPAAVKEEAKPAKAKPAPRSGDDEDDYVPDEPQAPQAVDKILGVARELFYRKGIRAIGVDEIVQRAGVTKPSLYRSFSSKDELTATYLENYEREFWKRFEEAVAAHPGDARAQIIAYMTGVAARALKQDHRGCGLSNAAVEYPGHTHPARLVAETHKKALRQRLRELAAEMGARDPRVLGDGLMLLIEGIYVSGQLSAAGPAQSATAVAEMLIDASIKPARPR